MNFPRVLALLMLPTLLAAEALDKDVFSLQAHLA